MFPHPLNNFETHEYYQNETRFNGLYSRNHGWASIINLDKHDDTRIIGLLFILRIKKQNILIVLVFSVFLKKSKKW